MGKKIGYFLSIVSLILFSFCLSTNAKNNEKKIERRPNILYIYTDDQTYRSISCYPGAYEYANTPNIDKLAKNGIMFSQAYTGAKCVPSRASTLTGRLQFNVKDSCRRYWAEDFREQGYTTGMIGKWHWKKGREMHQHGEAWDWSVVWDHGQKEEHKTYYWGQSVIHNAGESEKLEGYSTDKYTDYAIKFINDNKDIDKPWYLWLCYAAVHGPYTPADRHIGRYKEESETPIPSDVFGPRPGKPEHMNQFTKWKEQDGKPEWQGRSFDSWVKQYNEAVIAIDEGIGRIYKTLINNDQLDNTIIIFTSDQGFAWGDHGLRDKRYPYDAALRNPLIIYGPNFFAKGKICSQPVNGPDIVRTIHSIADVKPGIPLDGRDFSVLLNEEVNDDSWTVEPMIQAYTVGFYDSEKVTDAIKRKNWKKLKFDNSPAWIMLHDGRYKYTRYLAENCIEELYDLKTDINELNNLAVKEKWHERLTDMRGKTLDAFRGKGAAFVDILPEPKILSQ